MKLQGPSTGNTNDQGITEPPPPLLFCFCIFSASSRKRFSSAALAAAMSALRISSLRVAICFLMRGYWAAEDVSIWSLVSCCKAANPASAQSVPVSSPPGGLGPAGIFQVSPSPVSNSSWSESAVLLTKEKRSITETSRSRQRGSRGRQKRQRSSRPCTGRRGAPPTGPGLS